MTGLLAAEALRRIVVALDVPSTAEAERLIERLSPRGVVYKIGLELIYAGGVALAAKLAGRGERIFLDAKLLDIGHTVERAAASAAATGARFLTVHAADGKTLRAAVQGRGSSPMRLLAVTVLTNLDAADLAEQGFHETAAALVLRRARMARDAGFDGVIASPHEAQAVREAMGPDFLIVTPGVRPHDASSGDQARTATPRAAIEAGADYLVAGRPIVQAPDPALALDAIAAEIQSAIPRSSDRDRF